MEFFTLCKILRFVVASAAEAELGALFLNCKQATIFWLALEEMGHPQLPTTGNCNNSTVVGIVNNTVTKINVNGIFLGCWCSQSQEV
jgi:hypothetical protein